MNIFNALWKATPVYALWDFGKSTFRYLKDKRIVGETFYSDAFRMVIKKYLKINLKKDWIGRLYGVTNPNIVDGKFDVTSMIIEINDENTNNEDQVKNWAFKQMQLIATLFKIEKLYDYISMEFKHVGPKEFDNYLIVFDITSRRKFAAASKYVVCNLALWGLTIWALFGHIVEFIHF